MTPENRPSIGRFGDPPEHPISEIEALAKTAIRTPKLQMSAHTTTCAKNGQFHAIFRLNCLNLPNSVRL